MDAFVHITGHAGTDVEVRGNGTVASFRLASTPRVRSKGEWSDGNTTWLEVSCFRALAEHVAASVRRGDPLVVVGRLRTSVWEKDGQTHERLVLEAETVGHDLNRGVTMFRRQPRAAVDPQDVSADPEDVAAHPQDVARSRRDAVEPAEKDRDGAGEEVEGRTATAA
jgi:single-strand DNA-binding protein